MIYLLMTLLYEVPGSSSRLVCTGEEALDCANFASFFDILTLYARQMES